MVSKKVEVPTLEKNGKPELNSAEKEFLSALRPLVGNVTTTRADLLKKLFDARRDIDDECGYPKDITPEQYRRLYDREGVGHRVVTLLPQESWAMDPHVFESEDPEDITEFEQAWMDLLKDHNLFHWLQRIDEVSGIGRFGVLLMGFDDGQDLDQPMEGFDENGMPLEGRDRERKLLYLRAFDESVVCVKSRVTDERSPRFQQPEKYSVEFGRDEGASSAADRNVTVTKVTREVHWTRILHVADNRQTSEVYGTPRMQVVYNRIYDIRKVLSGSGEMFWKGAFPGFSFEVNPEQGDAELDTTALRKEFQNYAHGLQRYLALNGVTAKSLAPQVSDPSKHIMAQLENIAIALGIPKRIFLGSEQAQLASAQDTKTWNKRLGRRQHKYLSPMIIRPFIDRLIAVGVLPMPGEDGYQVMWPDLNASTDDEKATTAEKFTKALALYMSKEVDQLIPPAEFLTMVVGMEQTEVEQIIKAANEFQNGSDLEDDEDEE